jgi:hypothetical protein
VFTLDYFFDFGLFGARDSHHEELAEFFAFVDLVQVRKLYEWSQLVLLFELVGILKSP